MWDVLGRNKQDWQVKILGAKESHSSTHGLTVASQGHISEANDMDVVLFSSGKKGIKTVIHDEIFLEQFSLNSRKQLMGSICAGSFLLAKLGLLENIPATTHPDAKNELEALGIKTMDMPLICVGNIATAGGYLSGMYLVGWVIQCLLV